MTVRSARALAAGMMLAASAGFFLAPGRSEAILILVFGVGVLIEFYTDKK